MSISEMCEKFRTLSIFFYVRYKDNFYSLFTRLQHEEKDSEIIKIVDELDTCLSIEKSESLDQIFTLFIDEIFLKDERRKGRDIPVPRNFKEAKPVLAETVKQWKKSYEEVGYDRGILDGKKSGYNKGILDGEKTGYNKGMLDGEKSGYDKGILDGSSKKQVEIARNLLIMNIPEQQIISATGLSEEQLCELSISTPVQ